MSYQIKKTFVKKETYHIFFSIIISLLFSIIIVIILKGCLNKRNTEGESISKNNKSDDNCVNVELKSEATPEVKEKRESNHRVSIEPGMETIPEEDSEEENLKVGVTETKEEGLLNDKEITNSSLSVDLDSSKDDEYDDFFSESVISKELSCSEISPSKEVKFSPLITSTPNKEEDSKWVVDGNIPKKKGRNLNLTLKGMEKEKGLILNKSSEDSGFISQSSDSPKKEFSLDLTSQFGKDSNCKGFKVEERKELVRLIEFERSNKCFVNSHFRSDIYNSIKELWWNLLKPYVYQYQFDSNKDLLQMYYFNFNFEKFEKKSSDWVLRKENVLERKNEPRGEDFFDILNHVKRIGFFKLKEMQKYYRTPLANVTGELEKYFREFSRRKLDERRYYFRVNHFSTGRRNEAERYFIKIISSLKKIESEKEKYEEYLNYYQTLGLVFSKELAIRGLDEFLNLFLSEAVDHFEKLLSWVYDYHEDAIEKATENEGSVKTLKKMFDKENEQRKKRYELAFVS